MNFDPLIKKKRLRFAELEKELEKPDLFNDPSKAREIGREHAQTRKLLDLWEQYSHIHADIEGNKQLAHDEDTELAALASQELPELQKKEESLTRELQIALLPPEPGEDRDAIIEIRAGTGGAEAALFAADLYRMYSKYAEASNIKIDTLDTSPSEQGGFREVVFRMQGEAVFRKMRYESGVHRVQRVPSTEAQGRIHTSTATVAVMPEAEEVDIELRPQDLRIEVCRAGGPGGQGVNTTDSAVQVLHIPTGKIVRCQDGRSQQQNKERALQILRSRLLEEKQAEETEKYSAHRRNLIGRAGREEKIRTYNFPQNRITDHRIQLTLYSLDRFIEGEISPMLDALLDSDIEQRLSDEGEHSTHP